VSGFASLAPIGKNRPIELRPQLGNLEGIGKGRRLPSLF